MQRFLCCSNMMHLLSQCVSAVELYFCSGKTIVVNSHCVMFLYSLFLFFIAILTSSRAFQNRPTSGVTTRSLSNSHISKMALSQDELKKMVGYKAVDDYVASGMKVGLGTGSTAAYAVERVGQKLASGELKDIICVPTSERTREQALSLNIPLCTLNEESAL